MPGPEHDDLQATVRFQNGSSGTITYVTGGNARYPKETLDAAAGGRSARLDNFTRGHGLGRTAQEHHAVARRPGQGPAAARSRSSSRPCRTGAPMPISLDSLVATTRATLAVGESLASGKPERV